MKTLILFAAILLTATITFGAGASDVLGLGKTDRGDNWWESGTFYDPETN